MRVLLFGKNGQVGWELNRALQPLGDVFALGRSEADFTDSESLRNIVATIKPDVIVNSVAYTAVDRAEDDVTAATVINAESPGVLAEEALRNNALLVHFSTDYVFNGEKKDPYSESDTTDPINVYGRTKLAGEDAIRLSRCDYLIFRTSWVFASRGHNFLLTILRLAKERDELSIVSDQFGSPTSSRLIAETAVLCIRQSMRKKKAGGFSSDLFNLTASGYTSWYEFTCAIIKFANEKNRLRLRTDHIKAIPAMEYPTPARRPLNSRLVLSKLEAEFNLVMPDWKKGLQLCIEEISEY